MTQVVKQRPSIDCHLFRELVVKVLLFVQLFVQLFDGSTVSQVGQCVLDGSLEWLEEFKPKPIPSKNIKNERNIVCVIVGAGQLAWALTPCAMAMGPLGYAPWPMAHELAHGRMAHASVHCFLYVLDDSWH